MTTLLASFDGTERCTTRLEEPDRDRALRRLLVQPGPLSIRGSGLSYSNASAIDGGTTISTRFFDRILDFDPNGATIRVEAGLTIGALLRFVVERGLFFPVLPGHPQITVGGCAAFNTHGKTQHDVGHFSDHVAGLTLVHPDHDDIECGPDQFADIFLLTLGGMGLTGWIADVTLRLQPLPGKSIRRRIRPVRNFHDAVVTMESLGSSGAQLYSWNDANRRGRGFGRGVICEETFRSGDNEATARYRTLRPERRGRLVPIPIWNRTTTSIANRAWLALYRVRSDVVIPLLDAAFPMNGREGYFHLFGRRGFHEYQIVVPRDAWDDTVERVRRAIERVGACITLSSLKLFRGDRHLLWFRGEGVCVTLDGPATSSTRALFAELNRLAVELGVPVNLAKDSRLRAAAVKQIFAGYENFRTRLAAFDPNRRFDSALRRRIDV